MRRHYNVIYLKTIKKVKMTRIVFDRIFLRNIRISGCGKNFLEWIGQRKKKNKYI